MNYFYRNYKKQIIVHTVFNAFPIGVRLKIKKVLHYGHNYHIIPMLMSRRKCEVAETPKKRCQ